MTSVKPLIQPVPSALSDFSSAPSVFISSQSTSTLRLSTDMGRICNTLNLGSLLGSPPRSISAANSISTPHFISLRAMSSRSSTISASGKVLYLSIWANVTNLGPVGYAESTIRWFSRSKVLTTCFRLRNFSQSAMLMRSRFTASSMDVVNFSGLRFRANIDFWVSVMVCSMVDVCSTCLGYLGENLSTWSPSTTALPSPNATFTIPSSAFSWPMG